MSPISTDIEQIETTAVPALDVAREANAFLPASTKAGKPRVRMKWSHDVNQFIMRTYYRITKLETDMTTYRKTLHELFSLQYPDVNVSEQRISDQRRMIIKNKYLPQELLDKIKEEVSRELEERNVENFVNLNTPTQFIQEDHNVETQRPLSSTTTSQNYPHLTTCTQTSHTSTQTESITVFLENDVETISELPPPNDIKIQEMYNKLQATILQYSGLDPTARPKLPRLKYSKYLNDLIYIFNQHILLGLVTEDSQLIDIHTLIYCTALVISQELNYKIQQNTEPTRKKENPKAEWQIRLERDVDKLRADIGRLTQYINNNRSDKLVKRVQEIFSRYSKHTKHENDNRKPEEFLDTLKQKLALKSNRLKRYKKAEQRKKDNIQFATNEKTFYRNLGKQKTDTIQHSDPPTKEQLENYWSGIWEEKVQHNVQADWILKEKEKWENIEEMEFEEVTESDLTNITARLHNWKSPGIDKIHNFWYKKLTTLHKFIAKNITEIILGKQNIPNFIATGITYMLPKIQNSTQPSQYRPITCLPTIYKIITATITKKITTHIEHHGVLAEEQKGCRRGHMGCKEQLVIDSTIHKHAASKNRNLHCTYIDYKKAFDSIPHSWLIQILQIYKINAGIINFLHNIMTHWKTTLQLNQYDRSVTTRQIQITKGIYQGDSLSPLWFCLALNPLSNLLHKCRTGYNLNNNSKSTIVSHLIYMDDIKLYSKTEKDMKKLIDVTAEFSKDINMQFGLDKCKTIHIIKGKIQSGDYTVNNTDIISAMESTDLYKYLGYNQLKGLQHTTIKQTLTTEYKRRINAICKTQLSAKHLTKAINTYAIPVLTYSFGIIKWTKTDVQQIERTTRTTLTKYNNLHPKSAVERFTIKRQDGGRGVIDVHHLWQKQISSLRQFFNAKSAISDIHSAIVHNDQNLTPLNLADHANHLEPNNRNPQNNKIEDWKKKALHGRHPHDLEHAHIDKIASNKWLKLGNLFPETEGFMIAIQDQVINTKNYRKHIIKDPQITNDKCRRCHMQPETIQHITGACTTLTQTDYTHRHNQIANIIHQKLALKHNLIQKTNTPYYNYSPQTILENTTHKLYYDRAILTDKTIHYNRPDITLRDKLNKTTYLIDIAVPNTHNIQKTIAEKINKYSELKDEVTRIWKQDKVYVVPIVLSTTGIIPNHLHHSIKLIDLPQSTYIMLQKAAILNTCRIVRKFMQIDENIAPHNIT